MAWNVSNRLSKFKFTYLHVPLRLEPLAIKHLGLFCMPILTEYGLSPWALHIYTCYRAFGSETAPICFNNFCLLRCVHPTFLIWGNLSPLHHRCSVEVRNCWTMFVFNIKIYFLTVSAKSVIKRTLQIFEDWIENVAGEVVKSKQICYQSLQEVIEVALAVFPVYLHQPGGWFKSNILPVNYPLVKQFHFPKLRFWFVLTIKGRLMTHRIGTE